MEDELITCRERLKSAFRENGEATLVWSGPSSIIKDLFSTDFCLVISYLRFNLSSKAQFFNMILTLDF